MSALQPTGLGRARERMNRVMRDPVIWQGAAGIVTFFVFWQLLKTVGLLAVLPSPLEVVQAVPRQVTQEGYWMSWVASARRVFLGFFAASALAIALGVSMGMSRKLRQAGFPILEIFRPIPPLAWLPLSILFWPGPEMTMVFLTFLGAFFPVFINVLAGIDSIDVRYVQAARSLGASQATLFWRVMVPGALPSLFHGSGDRHRHHVGSGDRRRDGVRAAGPGLSHVERLHEPVAGGDRCRHAFHRRRRHGLQRRDGLDRPPCNALAARPLKEDHAHHRRTCRAAAVQPVPARGSSGFRGGDRRRCRRTRLPARRLHLRQERSGRRLLCARRGARGASGGPGGRGAILGIP
ncbi:MAG: ABC transporter permease [Betaproteobacteria bacterium]|nr:ABC transporter permease [Betaproteobacteria bacterium]